MNSYWDLLPPSMPDTVFIFEDDQIYGIRGHFEGKDLKITSNFNEYFEIPSLEDSLTPQELSHFVERALLSLGNPERASLVLPDYFLRMQTVEIENFPKDKEEINKILLWQARRNLAHPVNNLRIRYKILEKENGFAKVWLCAGPEEMFSLFEKIFREKHCHIGFITSPILSISEILSRKGFFETNDIILVMSITSQSLTFFFFKDGEPLFFRTKEIKVENDFEERVAQEVKLTLLFQREKLSAQPIKKVFYRINNSDFRFPVEEFENQTEAIAIEDAFNLSGEYQIPSSALIPFVFSIWEYK